MKPVLIIVALVLVAGAYQKASAARAYTPLPVDTGPKMASTTPDFEQEIQWIRKYQQTYPGRTRVFDEVMTDYMLPNWA